MNGWIVAGIDTEVGKTIVSMILAEALEADYWKPVEIRDSDTETVKGLSSLCCHPPLYRFADVPDMLQVVPPQGISLPPAKRLVIEGCGGVMTFAPLYLQWHLPWVIVSRHYLGSINHTLLTISWLQSHHQKIAGIIFNGAPNPSNEQFILSSSQLPCLGHLYPEKTLDQRTIKRYADQFKPHLAPLYSEKTRSASFDLCER